MRKSWIVAKHEFVVTVKRVWFVVATFVLPLLLFVVAGGMLLLASKVATTIHEERSHMPLGLVDQWGELRTEPRDFKILRFPEETQARRAFKEDDVSRRITTYLVVPKEYMETGRVQVVTVRRPTLLTTDRPLVPPGLEGWLVENVLRETDPARVRRAQVPFRISDTILMDEEGQVSSEDPRGAAKRSGVAYAFFFLLFMSIFTSSAYLLQGMAEEKENRVMEMVLSSVTPAQLMFGKLLGLGAAGLLQLFVWVVMGVTGALSFAAGVVLEPGTFFFCLLFFFLGYALYGSLMLGFGALGTNFRESQQMASIWSFIGVSPAFVAIALIEQPQGALARVFSFIPFTSPTTMMFRYTIDPKGTPVLDIVVSILLLAATTTFAVKLSARLYRAGLLLYGKRPRLREIWRWLLEAR